MIKILGAVLLLLGTTSFGLYMGCRYNSRLHCLQEFKKAFLHIQGEIRYMNTPMPETFEITARMLRGVCREFFERVAAELSAGMGAELKAVWERTVKSVLTSDILEREAASELSDMGGQLGCLDRQAQEKAIEYFLKKWDVLIERRQQEKKSRLKLYYACGIMGGLMMVIILL